MVTSKKVSSEEMQDWINTASNAINTVGNAFGQIYGNIQATRERNSNNVDSSNTNTSTSSLFGTNGNGKTLLYIGGGVLALLLGVLIFKK